MLILANKNNKTKSDNPMKKTIIAALISAAALAHTAAWANNDNRLVDMRSAVDKAPRLQALNISNNGDIWASGTKGTVVVSRDKGVSWQQIKVAGSETLQFRDIWANGHDIYLLAAGEAEKSRLYRSSDNGQHWQLQYTMDHPKGFINCFDFWDKDNGIVFGDSIDDKLFMLSTQDGGKHWQRIANAPQAQEGGEGGFSASGSCVRISGNDGAWVVTGATKNTRLLQTKDRGQSWLSKTMLFPKGSTAGIFSAMPQDNWLFGGRMKTKDLSAKVTALHKEQSIWQQVKGLPFTGAIYGSARSNNNIILVNPEGAALSKDNGKTWQKISQHSYWVVEFDQQGNAWLAGPDGRISQWQEN